jgi:hypothetical protein
MKTKALAMLIALACSSTPCFAGSVHLTGNLGSDFSKGPTAQQVISTFTDPAQQPYGGFGWEVVLGKMGFGGDYSVSFFRNDASQWWLDWYGQPLFISFHPLRSRMLLDPYLQAGLGSAGRVFLGEWSGPAPSNLYLSIFPFAAAGLSLNLEGFLVGAKVSYAPFLTPPPATGFSNAPIGNIQVTLSVGVALGWWRDAQ